MSERSGRQEKVMGWYHSHPGYGCWLSGIDVNTQKQNQQFQDPWLAIVVRWDSHFNELFIIFCRLTLLEQSRLAKWLLVRSARIPRDISQKVSRKQSTPRFHWTRFKILVSTQISTMSWRLSFSNRSPITIIWISCGISTGLIPYPPHRWLLYVVVLLLSQHTDHHSCFMQNREYTNGQVSDIANKLEKAENDLGKNAHFAKQHMLQTEVKDKKKEETAVAKINKDNVKLGIEVLRGVISQLTKDALFNTKV